MRFKKPESSRPGEVRIRQQHRMARSRAGRGDGPGIRSPGSPAFRGGDDGLLPADKGEVNHALQVGEDVGGMNRQHDQAVGVDFVFVLGSVVVDSLRKGIEVASKRGGLALVPVPRALGDAHGSQPAIRFQMFFSPVLGGARPSLAVEAQQQVPVGAGLRPPEGVEEILFVAREDVRDAVTVPEDFGVGRACTRAA